ELAQDQRALAARHAQPAASDGEDQRRIATALRNLELPDATEEQAEAVRRAEHAAAVLSQRPQVPDALAVAEPGPAAGRAAAEAAGPLAGRLARHPGPSPAPPAPPSPPADPELGLTPAQPAAAEQLARRERQLRERLQGFLAERIAPQQDLRE